eukprot:TRINITY_DN10058_c0_g1_i1.p1 TRINITY_DN10058_c0_g1~~TRINITY_DN10058_c0_g1_i1.p1  ORF type:complete len:230 (-),score=26.01 TRINITY_DN10058_c0_g1_i1:746-1435(-)
MASTLISASASYFKSISVPQKPQPIYRPCARRSQRTETTLCTGEGPSTFSSSDKQIPYLPTKRDICRAAMAQNLKLQLKTWGPYFAVEARSTITGEEVGRANGFITAWFGVSGRILHLESLKMSRLAFKSQNSIFGPGLVVGALAVRHGFDCYCSKAELLAVNDSDLYHSKLVRYYTRLGFKSVYEVTGSSVRDILHMLVWGAVGTRMDADIEDLLAKWSSRFRASDSD